MAEAAWMPLWVGDFVSDTAHLSDAETGQYLLILMHMWRNGGELPDNAITLARVARCKRVSPIVMAFFKCGGGVITQKRLSAELSKARDRSVKARANASARWLNNNDTDYADACADAMLLHSQSQSTSKASKAEKHHSAQERGSCLPKNWEPSRELLEWAKGKGYSTQFVIAETENFKLWAEANRNRQVARKADWSRTWQGWMNRKWPEYQQRAKRNGTAQHQPTGKPKLTYREQKEQGLIK